MAGSLHQFKTFHLSHYIGIDGCKHFEIIHDEGDIDVVSLTNWTEMKAYARGIGITDDLWPEFMECEEGIDIPMPAVEAKQAAIRESLSRLTMSQIGDNDLLGRIARYVANGDTFFFCP